MANKRSFSVQLDDVPTPQGYERAGAYVERAGELEGQAKVTDRKADLAFAGELFQQGAAAVKGYAEADIAKTTKDAISRYEDSPENVRGAELAGAVDLYDQARTTPAEQEQMGVVRGSATNEDPSVAELRAEANRYRTAEQQGLLTRQEVLDRVAGAVKKWSARLPGLQSDFRKAAADETGISNIDVYAIHKALTTESVREKSAERMAKANEKYIQDVAAYRGIPPSSVTPKDMQMFYMHKQLENEKTSAEAQAKVLSLNAETRGRALDGLIAVQNNNNVLTLSEMFSNWDKLNADPSNTKERDLMAARISSSVGQMRLNLIDYVTRQAAEKGVDASVRLAEIKKVYDEYDSLLKTKGGFDTMRLVIGRRKDSVEDMGNRFDLANPMLMALGRMRLTSDVFNLWMDKGEDALAKKVGPEYAKAYSEFFRNPQAWIQSWERAVSPDKVKQFGPVDLRGPEGAHYTPEQRAVVIKDSQLNVERAASLSDLSPQENEAAKTSLFTLTTNVKATEPRYIKELNTVLDNPGMEAYLNTVPSVERRAIAEPMFGALAVPFRESAAEARERLNMINTDPNNRALAHGWKLEVQMQPDGVLKSVWVRDPNAPTPTVTFGAETPGGAVVGMQGSFDMTKDPRFMGVDYESNKRLLDASLAKVNLYGHGLSNAHKIRGEQPEMTKAGIGAKVTAAINGMEVLGAMTPQETMDDSVAGRRRRPEVQMKLPPIDADHVAVAIRTAEGTINGKNVGDSGKGTLGPYQLKEEAVKDVLGRAYNAEKLEFYRTNKDESKRIAVAYWNKLLRRFGDVEKATAAYNWGPTNLSEHLKKLKPGEDWKRGIPAETKKYLVNFRKPYGEYYPGETDPVTGARMPPKTAAGKQRVEVD